MSTAEMLHEMAAKPVWFVDTIERDYSKCEWCGGFRFRTFNCDDTECDSWGSDHFHQEHCWHCTSAELGELV